MVKTFWGYDYSFRHNTWTWHTAARQTDTAWRQRLRLSRFMHSIARQKWTRIAVTECASRWQKQAKLTLYWQKTRWCAVERRAWHWSHLPSRSFRLASPHATSTSSYHVPPTAVMWAERACPKASLTLVRQTVSSVHPCLFQTPC